MKQSIQEGKSLTPEQLMQPRIKVIADFWDNPFNVGDVIEFKFYEERFNLFDESLGMDWRTGFLPNKHQVTNQSYWLKQFTNYPHLFQELHWSSERKPEEMPAYVKDKNEVYKVRNFDNEGYFEIYNLNAIKNGSGWSVKNILCLGIYDILPATEAEYLNYIKNSL